VKLTNVAPAATVTVAGTIAAAVLLLDSVSLLCAAVPAAGAFNAGWRHRWGSGGKSEAVQNLPGRLRRMDHGDDPHEAGAAGALKSRFRRIDAFRQLFILWKRCITTPEILTFLEW